MLIELPVLVAVAAKPVPTIVVPLVGEPHRDSVLAEGPDFFDQPVIELARPLARQERLDGLPALEKLRSIAPAAVGRVGKRDARGVARVPGVLGETCLLRCALEVEWW